MLINKKKIAGAALVGTLALGALGGATAFAAEIPSLNTADGVVLTSVDANAVSGPVLTLGQTDLSDMELPAEGCPTFTLSQSVGSMDLAALTANTPLVGIGAVAITVSAPANITGDSTVTTAPMN